MSTLSTAKSSQALANLLGDDLHVPVAGRQLITPQRARALLDNNRINRPISRSAVHRLAAVLKAGEWRYNGEAIKFGTDGTLLDGQHRLSAIAESEVAAELLVVTGLKPDAFATLDQGRKRSGGDVLFTRNVAHATHVAVACSMVYRLLRNKAIYGGNTPLPAYGIDEIYARHPGIADAVEFCFPISKRGDNSVIGLGYLAAYLYVGQTVMGQGPRALQFAEGIATGVDLADNSPVLQFRHKVLGRHSGKVMQAQAKMALFAKAFGLFMSERTVKNLTPPNTSTSYAELIPQLAARVEVMTDHKAMRDMPY